MHESEVKYRISMKHCESNFGLNVIELIGLRNKSHRNFGLNSGCKFILSRVSMPYLKNKFPEKLS